MVEMGRQDGAREKLNSAVATEELVTILIGVFRLEWLLTVVLL